MKNVTILYAIAFLDANDQGYLDSFYRTQAEAEFALTSDEALIVTCEADTDRVEAILAGPMYVNDKPVFVLTVAPDSESGQLN